MNASMVVTRVPWIFKFQIRLPKKGKNNEFSKQDRHKNIEPGDVTF